MQLMSSNYVPLVCNARLYYNAHSITNQKLIRLYYAHLHYNVLSANGIRASPFVYIFLSKFVLGVDIWQ